jgi:membrane protein YqaA with SNARE-associated domain
LSLFKAVSAKLGHFLVVYGGWGILAISFMDSSFVPFPGVNDGLIIHLSSQRPPHAFIYAAQATVGSVLGALVMYWIGRGGGSFFWKRTSPEKIQRMEGWLRKNDFVTVLMMSVLPPPSPFKLLLLVAGMLRVNVLSFCLALCVGRGLRFGADAYLGVKFGAQAEEYLGHHLGKASILLVILILGVTFIWRRLRRPPAQSVAG